GGDAVFIETAGLAARLEDRRLDARDRESVRAGQTSRTRPDDRDALAGRRAALVGRLSAFDHRVGRVTLQEPDADGLAFGGLAHAGLFAQRLGRADARAHAAHDVGVENGLGPSLAVPARDLADEKRNVDRSRTGLLAGGVEAEIAALRLDLGLMRGERGMEIGEIRLDRRPVEATRRDVGKSWRVGGDRHGFS